MRPLLVASLVLAQLPLPAPPVPLEGQPAGQLVGQLLRAGPGVQGEGVDRVEGPGIVGPGYRAIWDLGVLRGSRLGWVSGAGRENLTGP